MINTEEWGSLPNDSNIVTSMEMIVGDERFAMGFVIDDYKHLTLKELADEIKKQSKIIARTHAAVFAGREDLRSK